MMLLLIQTLVQNPISTPRTTITLILFLVATMMRQIIIWTLIRCRKVGGEWFHWSSGGNVGWWSTFITGITMSRKLIILHWVFTSNVA
jgi:hypothetical protein